MRRPAAAGQGAFYEKWSDLLLFVFEPPLLHLYLYGPTFGSYGGWGGQALPDICAQLTSTSSQHWDKNMDLCADMVHTRFDGFFTLFSVTLYTVFVFWLFKSLAYFSFLLVMRLCSGGVCPKLQTLNHPQIQYDQTGGGPGVHFCHLEHVEGDNTVWRRHAHHGAEPRGGN